jgi:ryanodine receptor 2
MKKPEYIPMPIDTTDINLDDHLEALIEHMAKNVHEVWAKNRISQGWHYGPRRDDDLKTHPCLVPYEELPEVEKQYDRDTATSTLKLIIKLGFTIS